MSEGILVVNAGSSSLKLSVHRIAEARAVDPLPLVLNCRVEGIGNTPSFAARDGEGKPLPGNALTGRETTHAEALDRVLDWLDGRGDGITLRAAGHRIVHGGPRFDDAVRIDAEVLDYLSELTPLAPLHQPHNLAPVRALRERHADIAQVACFDTAFHRSQPEVAQRFALPRYLSEEGLKRYGFHGLSYAYIAQALPEWMGDAASGRVVVAHLGHGASMCALRDRRSVATTMGFTALDGLPMGKRCGNLDPGAVLYLLQQKGWSADEVADTLYHKSGLYGVSGISDDMAELLSSEAEGAEEAIALFCYRANRELGSLASALGGLDGLVFTAGIGERAPEIRRRIAAQASWLGVKLDGAANRRNAACISAPDSSVDVYVIPTNEERVIAEQTKRLCGL
jgi:acetate kinase